MTFSILGLGIATIDYLIEVDQFPVPNQKHVCKSLEIHGGGNCANTPDHRALSIKIGGTDV